MPEIVPTELPTIKIDTSKEEVLAKRSVFNPYPEKAGLGIQVWPLWRLTVDPGVDIRYPTTGQMYNVNIPIVYKHDKVALYDALKISPQGYDSDMDWVDYPKFWRSLCIVFVRVEASRANTTTHI
jgi:hypothetical protein